jgi:hypothetical protein
VTDLVTRDVQQISDIERPAEMRRLLSVVAARMGTLAVIQSMANDVALPRQKDPVAPVGPLLENFAIGEVARQLTWAEEPIQLFHYRDRDQVEVDMVLEHAADLGVHASRAGREEVIDAFAAELLLPSEVLKTIGAGATGISRSQLVELAARYRVSWSLALRQAAHASVLDPDSQRAMARVKPTRSEFLDALGWAPQPDLESIRVPPNYAHAVMEAVQRNAITPSRAVELMRGQIGLSDLPADDEPDDEP